MQDDPGYRAAVDALGGVNWGYSVQLLDDRSQPEEAVRAVERLISQDKVDFLHGIRALAR